MVNIKEKIAKRAALELKDGDIVNLGIGIPTMVANYIPKEVNVHIHSENGILGVGPSPGVDNIDPNLVNAGKKPITKLPGTSYFDSAQSFGMIRGGHIDVAILGVLEVEQTGLIANWSIPGETVLGVGGAMDLLLGVDKVIVTITHTSKDGTPKIVKSCNYPITGLRKADVIITELCVFHITNDELVLVELSEGVTFQEVRDKTGTDFRISETLLNSLNKQEDHHGSNN